MKRIVWLCPQGHMETWDADEEFDPRHVYCNKCNSSYSFAAGVSNVYDIGNTTEKVNHPAHYGGADNPYEVIKVLEHWLTREEFIGAMKFNIIKYQARARQKSGDEDYAKAEWYSNYLVAFLKRSPL